MCVYTEAGRVQTSLACARLIRKMDPTIPLIYRGIIEVKGKGMVGRVVCTCTRLVCASTCHAAERKKNVTAVVMCVCITRVVYVSATKWNWRKR